MSVLRQLWPLNCYIIQLTTSLPRGVPAVGDVRIPLHHTQRAKIKIQTTTMRHAMPHSAMNNRWNALCAQKARQRFQTPFAYPTISPPSNFESPNTRSQNVIGTSPMVAPACLARTRISIWKT